MGGGREREKEERWRRERIRNESPIITNDMHRARTRLVSPNKPRDDDDDDDEGEKTVLTDGGRSWGFRRMSVVITAQSG